MFFCRGKSSVRLTFCVFADQPDVHPVRHGVLRRSGLHRVPAEFGLCGTLDGPLHDGGDDRDGLRLSAAHSDLGVLPADIGRDEERRPTAGSVPSQGGMFGFDGEAVDRELTWLS